MAKDSWVAFWARRSAMRELWRWRPAEAGQRGGGGETKDGRDGRTGRLCVLVEGPDAAQTGARLYLWWVGDGRDGSRISRQGTVC